MATSPRRSAIATATTTSRFEILKNLVRRGFRRTKAFSSEVDTGSREENASKQEMRASVLSQSEPILL
jgi:hypothetical protein